MVQIKIENNVNGIEGLTIISPTVHKDMRGYFMETYSKRDLLEFGIETDFVQDNQSYSTKGILRGLHFQKLYPQTKLIRVITGCIYSVAVDLRVQSLTYGKWYGVVLDNINHKQFLIPKGFAHGFLVLSNEAIMCYKCDEFYHPEDETGIIWNDPDINIEWKGVEKKKSCEEYVLDDGSPIILSARDSSFKFFKDLEQRKKSSNI